MKKAPLLLALLFATASSADEGMWTYDNFPAARVGKKYGFTPDQKFLDEARLASVRLAGGCSGSFVSPDGLVMTNHHCAHRCIEQLSTKEKDYVQEGFYAPALEQEVKCPEIELNQLVKITDVTKRVHDATRGLEPGKAYDAARKTVKAALEKECLSGSSAEEKLRCDVVELYHGGMYSLYTYKRFEDVRLVFAPEFATAFFGGDPDNFNFPRYDLDVSFIRAWEDGKPARTEHFFRWTTTGPKDGQLTFVSGNPGGTDRDLTVAQLQFQRDFALPERLLALAEFRGALTMFTSGTPEHYRIGEADLFGVENSFKALKGRWQALIDPAIFNAKAEREKKLRARAPKKVAGAWDDIARALAQYTPRRKEYMLIEGGQGFMGRLFEAARLLVRGSEELQKPNGERLKEYTDAKLPALKQKLFSKAPVYTDLEIFKLSFSLTKLREELGADHPFVKKVLGKRTPGEVAAELVKSRLGDAELRKQLWQGGAAAVANASDPMLDFVRSVEPDARELRRWHDEAIEPLENSGAERVAAARFELEGKAAYPDATFSLRLSYGAVRGYEQNGGLVKPFTQLGGAFERATGRAPFRLPESWLMANEEKKLDPAVPLNFATDNDIIGGNSGSPVFDKDRQIVGLIFDGNLQSLGGDFFFDEKQNRAVAVDSAALTEALDKIYGAKRLVTELKQGMAGPM